MKSAAKLTQDLTLFVALLFVDVRLNKVWGSMSSMILWQSRILTGELVLMTEVQKTFQTCQQQQQQQNNMISSHSCSPTPSLCFSHHTKHDQQNLL